MSANYIYTEGKRLEAMSLRLLEIIVTKREKIDFQKVSAEMLFTYLENMFVTNRDMEFHFSYEPGMVWAEANLIKSVLVNLLDNACKASEPGSPVEVTGARLENGYRFSVKDQGGDVYKRQIHIRTLTQKKMHKLHRGYGRPRILPGIKRIIICITCLLYTSRCV